MNSVENIREALANNLSSVLSQLQNALPIRALYLKQTLFTVFFLVICLIFSILAGIGGYKYNNILFINSYFALVISVVITLIVYNFHLKKIKKLLPDMEIVSVPLQILCAVLNLLFYFFIIKMAPETVFGIIYAAVAFCAVIYGVMSYNNRNYQEFLKKIAMAEFLNQCDFIEYKNKDPLFSEDELSWYGITEETPSRLEFDDSWIGNFEGYNFRISELKVKIWRSVQCLQYYECMLKGIIFVFYLGKKSIGTPFKILKTAKKIKRKLLASLCAVASMVFLAGLYFTTEKEAKSLYLIMAAMFICFTVVLIRDIRKLTNKVSSIKFKPNGSSQKKIDIVSDNLNSVNAFLDEELLQCYFNMRKIFKTDDVNIFAGKNRVYVSIKTKNFFEFANLYSSKNPLKQIEEIINQIVLFMYLIDIFDRKIKNKEH